MAGLGLPRNRFSPKPDAGGGGGGSGIDTVEYHTVTAGELAAKQFNLLAAPTSVDFSDMVGGGPLHEGVDYSLAGVVYDWNGLGLDGVIAEGDIVRIAYD